MGEWKILDRMDFEELNKMRKTTWKSTACEFFTKKIPFDRGWRRRRRQPVADDDGVRPLCVLRDGPAACMWSFGRAAPLD